MIVEILREEGLPEDLAYIAMIESGFNPRAYSSARAVGLWQFMPRTGKHFGLDYNWWIDERRDPEKATRAAAKYFKVLYKRFNSWELAAASYNAGEGRVARALKKYKTDDYWELVKHKRSLKLETRDYVPKLMAAMIITKNPERYGFTDINYEEPIYYDKVSVTNPIDLNAAARASGTTVKDLRRLNPELKRWLTPPRHKGYEIRLPEGSRAAFLANMQDMPKPKRLDFHRHKILRGESLWDIARAYKTGMKPIMELNAIKNPRKIRAGKTLMIPVRAGTKVAKNYRRSRSSKQVINKKGIYTIQRGDTLWDISREFGVKIKELRRWNNLPRSGRIKAGEKLYIKEARLIK
jgi:membrane-bound lytic murein transglycosylase D